MHQILAHYSFLSKQNKEARLKSYISIALFLFKIKHLHQQLINLFQQKLRKTPQLPTPVQAHLSSLKTKKRDTRPLSKIHCKIILHKINFTCSNGIQDPYLYICSKLIQHQSTSLTTVGVLDSSFISNNIILQQINFTCYITTLTQQIAFYCAIPIIYFNTFKQNNSTTSLSEI